MKIIIQSCFATSQKTCLLIILLTTFLSANSQNHVANPGFETCTFLNPPGFTFCPDDESQMWKASAWNESWLPTPYDANMENWTYGSPDYSLIGSFLSYPYNTRTPHSGNGFAGAFQFSTTIPGMREYIVNKLATPLVSGQQYSVSFWAIMSNASFAKYSIAKMGIYFSVAAPPCTFTSPPCNAASSIMLVTPQVTTPVGVYPNGNWQQFTMTFTASAAYRYMTFGNFNTDAATPYTTLYPGASSDLSYMVVDDFDVHPITPLPVTLISYTAECSNGNKTIRWTTSSEFNCEGFSIERSKDGSIWEHIDFVTGSGNSNSIQQYRYIDNSNSNNLVYYRIIQKDLDGQTQVFPVISTECKTTGIAVVGSNRSISITGIENPTRVRVLDILGNTLFDGIIAENNYLIPIHQKVSATVVVIGNENNSPMVKKVFLFD